MRQTLNFVFSLIKGMQPGPRNKFNLARHLEGILNQVGCGKVDPLAKYRRISYGENRETMILNKTEIVFRKGIKRMR